MRHVSNQHRTKTNYNISCQLNKTKPGVPDLLRVLLLIMVFPERHSLLVSRNEARWHPTIGHIVKCKLATIWTYTTHASVMRSCSSSNKRTRNACMQCNVKTVSYESYITACLTTASHRLNLPLQLVMLAPTSLQICTIIMRSKTIINNLMLCPFEQI